MEQKPEKVEYRSKHKIWILYKQCQIPEPLSAWAPPLCEDGGDNS